MTENLQACPVCGGTGTAPGSTWYATGADDPPPRNCGPCCGSGLVEVESGRDGVRARPVRIVTPEQYRDGYVRQRGVGDFDREPYQLVKRLDDGGLAVAVFDALTGEDA